MSLTPKHFTLNKVKYENQQIKLTIHNNFKTTNKQNYILNIILNLNTKLRLSHFPSLW